MYSERHVNTEFSYLLTSITLPDILLYYFRKCINKIRTINPWVRLHFKIRVDFLLNKRSLCLAGLWTYTEQYYHSPQALESDSDLSRASHSHAPCHCGSLCGKRQHPFSPSPDLCNCEKGFIPFSMPL